jgi:hypothetical protein
MTSTYGAKTVPADAENGLQKIRLAWRLDESSIPQSHARIQAKAAWSDITKRPIEVVRFRAVM